MSKNKVSIIVPVYNVEKYLDRCLTSLVNQTLKEIEIIVVNDGSKDNSQKIIDTFKEKYSILKSFSKENGGLSSARNFGLKHANGEFVMFVDSDDYIKLDACEKLYCDAKKNKLDILMGNYINVKNGLEENEISDMDEKIYNGNEFIKKYYSLKNISLMSWLLFINNDFIKNNGLIFKEGFFHEDEDFTPRSLLLANRIKFLNFHFYYYVYNSNSITKRKDKTNNIKSIYTICDDLEKEYENIKDPLTKKLLLDRVVFDRLLGFSMQTRYSKDFCFEKNKLYGKAYKKNNKIKSFIYCLSPRLFYIVNRVKNGG